MKLEEIKRLRKLSLPFPVNGVLCIELTKEFVELFGKALDELEEMEENNIVHNITITKSENKVLEEYWLMRAVKTVTDDCLNDIKKVIAERECNHCPELNEIAQFLSDSNADFVSVEHNYRFEPDLPFC